MIRKQDKNWFNYLSRALKQLTDGKSLPFSEITPSRIPKKAGVHIISAKKENSEIPYYIGRSKNLRQRLYRNHLMGQLANARLKKILN